MGQHQTTCNEAGDLRGFSIVAPILFLKWAHALAGEFVGALVFGVTGVALHPVPVDFVFVAGGFERLPEIGVFDRLFGSGLPAVALPGMNPGRDAVLHVVAVGVEVDVGRAGERAQGFDDGLEFHAIVGRIGGAAEEFLAVFAPDEDGAPAAGARISRARPVGENGDLLGAAVGHAASPRP